ncbi:MAG: DNA topoisomerase [Clostridia bacterium]|nr:DNA topoisomerase [Clostridia bacterium]
MAAQTGAKKSAEYNDQSIQSLKGADRVRKRPGVIFGSDGLDGCAHSFFEILSNSIDEARAGFGDTINVTVSKDRVITVEDFGRGIPLDWNEKEGRFNWELIFCELYAGGKYENAKGGAYQYSLGLNGLGACATQYSSEFMDVEVVTKAARYEIHFKKGEAAGDLIKEDGAHRRTGTKITWRPDLEVFTEIAIPEDYFVDVMRRQAVVNGGLTLNLRYQGEDGVWKEYSFLYKEGILDYVREAAEINEFNEVTQVEGKVGCLTVPVFWEGERRGKDREDKTEYDVRMECSFCFSAKSQKLEYYHNSSWLEHGGSPEKAVKSSFLRAIDGYLKNTGKYNKNEQKISFQDVEDCLILVTNCFSNVASFSDQTKKKVTNKFIADAMTEFFDEKLEIYFTENPGDADRISQQVLINKRSRENAESARVNIKKKLSGTLDVTNRIEKFANCRSKDKDKRELYIVEGDSALGSCKLGRDAEFQAIIPVRGKTLNCLKCGYDRIFKSEIIVDLLRIIGCGVEIGKGHKDLAGFNYDNLKWNKIIICTDADEDGYQIRTLILTMFYRLLPTLIEKGNVYIAESPLYEITCKGKKKEGEEEIFFAYDEKEKNKILSEIGDRKYTIQRSKGLGENEPDMMRRTTMDPATRRLIRIMPEDEAVTREMFEIHLGDDLDGRKRYISENGHLYIDMADAY